MSAPTGTATIQVLDVTLTPGDKYASAKGNCVFAGQELVVEAYGRAAEELAANSNSSLIAEVEIQGGSNQPRIKIRRVLEAAAPQIDDRRIARAKEILNLNSKATKAEVLKAVASVKEILQ